jgi:hypothetical protein
MDNMDEPTKEENNAEDRKNSFNKTLKTAGLTRKFLIIVLAIFFGSYFVQLSIFHNYY